MSYDIPGLQKLVQSRRTRVNMEKVQGRLEELEEVKVTLESWLESVEELKQHLGAFIEITDQFDSDFMSEAAKGKLVGAANELLDLLPEQDGSLGGLAENYDTASSGLEELESMLEDRDLGAEDRDEKWDEILTAIDEVATGLDELSVIGVDLTPQKSE